MKKITGKAAAVAAMSVMTVAGTVVSAGPAVADPQSQVYTATYASRTVAPPPQLIGPNGEKPTEWGVASFPVNSSATSVTPMVSESAGGGTWSHGTVADGVWKGCYSNYTHPTKKHSASISIAAKTDKDTQSAGIWAKAYATAGWSYTCYTYWGVY
ncbi:lactococcin 972 family bacteriocin [Streptomyces sp. NPDC059506]|uniref:lactococcin 972 family bacteriocin n=1 Tax=Streptomyces sp. NPDC059506 TaxID=3347751 RepID=UPI002690203E